MHYSLYKNVLLNSMAEHFLYEKYCWAPWNHYKLGFSRVWITYRRANSIFLFNVVVDFFFSLQNKLSGELIV